MAGKANKKKKKSKPHPTVRLKTAGRKTVKADKSRQSKGKPKPTTKAKSTRTATRTPPRKARDYKAGKNPAKARRKVESAAGKVAPRAGSKASPFQAAPAPKPTSKQFAGAVHAYEMGIKLMYAEEYQRAIQRFNELIANYPDEQEIQASAKARIHACENKLHERARTVFRSADDHYNIAVALLNSGDFQEAAVHLQQALKLAPKGDHILYALAAANALLGNKDQAVSYLRQSIHYRPENRFQAAQDHDFQAVADEPEFKELIAPPEK